MEPDIQDSLSTQVDNILSPNTCSNKFSNPRNNQITPQMTSNLTFIKSSTSISEPNKPFEGLDHQCSPEEYLQHIFATQRNIFSWITTIKPI